MTDEQRAYTVLAVEDNPHTLELLSYSLSDAGFNVLTADDAHEALSLLQSQTVDVVVCDIMMPQMDGFAFRETLMQDPVYEEIAFLFLTAKVTPQDQVRGLRLGADEYITKPFDPQVLVARLEAVLARRESYARRANCDPLTNLLNRTAFEREVRRELRRAERYPAISSFAFMDIDNFKEVNDSYGHAAGDRVLVTLASVMNAAFRSVDIIGRFGGEEFVVYLPETPEPRALIVLQRLQELFAEAQEGAGHPVRGFSAGVVEIPRDGADLEGLRDRADAAMYAAKRQGKGRVVPWRPGLEAQNEESPANSG